MCPYGWLRFSSKNWCQPLDNRTSWNWEDKQQRHASPLSVLWTPSFYDQHLRPNEETHYVMEASPIQVLAPTRLYYHEAARPKGHLYNKDFIRFKISPYPSIFDEPATCKEVLSVIRSLQNIEPRHWCNPDRDRKSWRPFKEAAFIHLYSLYLEK